MKVVNSNKKGIFDSPLSVFIFFTLLFAVLLIITIKSYMLYSDIEDGTYFKKKKEVANSKIEFDTFIVNAREKGFHRFNIEIDFNKKDIMKYTGLNKSIKPILRSYIIEYVSKLDRNDFVKHFDGVKKELAIFLNKKLQNLIQDRKLEKGLKILKINIADYTYNEF